MRISTLAAVLVVGSLALGGDADAGGRGAGAKPAIAKQQHAVKRYRKYFARSSKLVRKGKIAPFTRTSELRAGGSFFAHLGLRVGVARFVEAGRYRTRLVLGTEGGINTGASFHVVAGRGLLTGTRLPGIEHGVQTLKLGKSSQLTSDALRGGARGDSSARGLAAGLGFSGLRTWGAFFRLNGTVPVASGQTRLLRLLDQGVSLTESADKALARGEASRAASKLRKLDVLRQQVRSELARERADSRAAN